ncbi:type II toxin-antitoxin system HipA family toxin, partial [Paucibacter sp. R3-3]|nr:type II toxin-antitoxin system HipA family toxin [Paucibacter sp. R3-3]
SVRGKSAHSQLDYVKPRHWALEARRSGVPDMLRAMVWLATTVPDAIQQVERELPEDFPMHIWDSITTGFHKAAEAFLNGIQNEED